MGSAILFGAFWLNAICKPARTADSFRIGRPVPNLKIPYSDDPHAYALLYWLNRRAALVLYQGREDRIHVRRLDSRTGTLTTQRGLGVGLEGQLANGPGVLVPTELSPDHRFLIGFRDTNEKGKYEVVGVSNRFHRTWPSSLHATHEVRWLDDSRHWFYWDTHGPPCLVVRSLTHRKPVRWQVSGLPKLINGWSQTTILGLSHKLGVIVRTAESGDDKWSVHLFRFRPTPHAHAVPMATCHWPPQFREPESVNQDIVLSPKGDRLAWVSERVIDASSGEAALSLFVSNVDGSHFRKVGETHWQEKPLNLMLEDLTWNPNGKQIGFILHHRLWLVDTD